MSLVKSIRIACIKENKTIPTLEDELHWCRGTICRWDKCKPSIDKVVKVARRLNCTVDSLVVDLYV